MFFSQTAFTNVQSDCCCCSSSPESTGLSLLRVVQTASPCTQTKRQQRSAQAAAAGQQKPLRACVSLTVDCDVCRLLIELVRAADRSTGVHAAEGVEAVEHGA